MLIETDETNQFTFEPFAAHAFYTKVNRSLVHQALAHFESRPADQPLTVVDMACGTGAVTRLIDGSPVIAVASSGLDILYSGVVGGDAGIFRVPKISWPKLGLLCARIGGA